MATQYTVICHRAGQPRAYADSEYVYTLKIEQEVGYGDSKGQMKPWVYLGDVEASIKKDEQLRKEGKMWGGQSPEQMRKAQRDWAIKLVKTLCMNFRERSDDDGRTGMDAHFYPTLQLLQIDPAMGEIRVSIIDPFTD